MFYGQITTGASDDIQKLTQRAYLCISLWDDSNFNTFYYNLEQNDRYSNDLRNNIDTAVQNIITQSYDRTKEILQENRDFVIAIKDELINNDTITKDILDDIAIIKFFY